MAFYITLFPPSFSTKDCALLRDKKHGRKVALYLAVPSILRLENGNSAFADVFTACRLGLVGGPSFL